MRATLQPIAYLRFLNALPFNPTVNLDIYVNDRLIYQDLPYAEFTEYFKARPGTHKITVFPSGNTTEPLLSYDMFIEDYRAYTAAVTGLADSIEMKIITEYPGAANPNLANIRFVSLAPNIRGVNILIDSRLVIYDLNYGEISNYLALEPGSHTLRVEVSGTDRTVASHPGMNLMAGNVYTTYVIGLVNAEPFIEVLIPLEGISYIQF